MTPVSRDHFSSGWRETAAGAGGSATRAADVALDPKLLPFEKGPLSFGVGVNLKMAVSRWTDWAHDAGLREEKGTVEG